MRRPRQPVPFHFPEPTPQTWVMPPELAALDRLEREVVEDVAAAILSAKRSKARVRP
jgi:hypothetical protein